MKKIYNFPKKSGLPTFILPVKFCWLIFSCGFWGGNEKFADIRAGSLSGLTALLLDFVLTAMPCTFVFQLLPAASCAPM